ncbi:MAG: M50 family peptidase [Gemmatimonadales bacterium]|nr:MAG: M50 family peptidase [Gemmatimonadales bacterium]
MPSILLVLLLLWVVTTVHEAGHALAVRLKGGRVEAFEVGRGPALRTVSPGGTRLALGLFPFGGKLVYRGVPKGTGHAVVALAGPVANLLLAFLLLRSAVRAGQWFWLVPGSVVEILGGGRAIGLLQGMRLIGSALASPTAAGLAFALGALSAVWAGLNLLPIPGVGSDGWAIVRSLAAAFRGERGRTRPAPEPKGGLDGRPDGRPGESERREVS